MAAHFAARARTSALLRSQKQGQGAPRTNGGGCRPGGDAGWQFRLKAIKDERIVRPSADRARPGALTKAAHLHFYVV
jgi:hypothetical protein